MNHQQSVSLSPVKENLIEKEEVEKDTIDYQIERINGSMQKFFLHFKATVIKRLRVIKRDYKSFIL
jgi:hypothetical protein